MAKKILITGGAGFIGSHLVETYLEAGFTVVVVDKKENPDTFAKLPLKYYQQDIGSPEVEHIFQTEKPDIINHHAALINVTKSLLNPVEYTRTNVLATINLLELAKKYEVEQFIFASSAAVYGLGTDLPIRENSTLKPMSFYGLDKMLCEYYLNLYNQDFITTIFRYANVYGPRQTCSAEGGVVAIFCQSLASNKAVSIFGDGQQTRDFIFVKDIAQANLQAVKQNIKGLMHVSTGTKTTINDLYNLLSCISQTKLKPDYQPERSGDIRNSVLDNSSISQILDWKTKYSLEQGLKLTWEYFRNESDLIKNQ